MLHADHIPCPRCDPTPAPLPRRPCSLCKGAGQVTRALAQIYTAHRLARAIAPEWKRRRLPPPGDYHLLPRRLLPAPALPAGEGSPRRKPPRGDGVLRRR
jgi:hypothetical protein